ncbi:endonuclease/exonuclease/phosphatase family protein [Candidatus Laterigemmans baculatus]|uniref:endonuclease/exonuclease/phosphatase family protein n=1 Tax=Candidatus Laterigemmans baculatus TaxID=2770505 RepID=UPI0013D96BAF|nr:endonuclease/exonuclease/phosphatase family protein [Candidatus Laterigemmans baculatus]
MIRLLTYNIRYGSARDGEDAWPARQDSVARALREADVVGLQEVEVDQLRYLERALPEFRFIGVGRTDGKEAGEFSPLAVRTSRFKTLQSGTFWLSPTPEQIGSRGWDAQLPRIATWAVIEDLRSGGSWGIINTHFDHVGSEARRQSGRLIRERTGTFPATSPVVVLGDLNAGPDSPPLQALTAPPAADPPSGSRQLYDARSVTTTPPAGPTGTWNGFREIDPDKRIDHILVSSNVRVESYEVLDPRTPAGRFASDHLPIEVVLAPQSPANR